MSEYEEMVCKFMQEGKVVRYENELIENLRNKYYAGVPLSITLNSGFCCNCSCHHMALQITRGMDYFKIINGNINLFPSEPNGNHSWVEKDGWVYDTSDGLKWVKDIYYQVFGARVIDEYDETNYLSSWFYRKELMNSSLTPNEHTARMIDLIEALEIETPHVNHKRLMAEICLYRESFKITKKMSREEIRQYKKIISEELESKDLL